MLPKHQTRVRFSHPAQSGRMPKQFFRLSLFEQYMFSIRCGYISSFHSKSISHQLQFLGLIEKPSHEDRTFPTSALTRKFGQESTNFVVTSLLEIMSLTTLSRAPPASLRLSIPVETVRRHSFCESTNKNGTQNRCSFLWLCSHQESNLDRRYRKPAFYPLNYESCRGNEPSRQIIH